MFLQKTYELVDYIYAPRLNGTESITQLSGTTTISNGEMSGGSGIIGAFDNTGDWICTLEAKFSSSNCGFGLYAPTDNTRDNNCVKYVAGSTETSGGKIYPYVSSVQGAISSSLGSKSYNTYHAYTIKKENGVLTFQQGNNSPVSVSWNLINTLSTLKIGVDTWGHVCTIKNIRVKAL